MSNIYSRNRYSRVFASHVIKTKNRNPSIDKFRNLNMIDDCKINNFAKNQLSAVFHSRAIRRSVSPKLLETPCLCPSEGLKHGGRDVKQNICR